MDAVGSVDVNTNYGSYSGYESASANVPAEIGCDEVGAAFSDSSIIGTFASGNRTDLNDLYGQKAQVESELGDITFEKYDAQSRVNARKLALVRDRQSGGEYAEENEAMGGIQQYYGQVADAREEAQQAYNQAKQESSANEQAINSNAQQCQSVSAQLSSAQSRLASLTLLLNQVVTTKKATAVMKRNTALMKLSGALYRIR